MILRMLWCWNNRKRVGTVHIVIQNIFDWEITVDLKQKENGIFVVQMKHKTITYFLLSFQEWFAQDFLMVGLFFNMKCQTHKKKFACMWNVAMSVIFIICFWLVLLNTCFSFTAWMWVDIVMVLTQDWTNQIFGALSAWFIHSVIKRWKKTMWEAWIERFLSCV